MQARMARASGLSKKLEYKVLNIYHWPLAASSAFHWFSGSVNQTIPGIPLPNRGELICRSVLISDQPLVVMLMIYPPAEMATLNLEIRLACSFILYHFKKVKGAFKSHKHV